MSRPVACWAWPALLQLESHLKACPLDHSQPWPWTEIFRRWWWWFPVHKQYRDGNGKRCDAATFTLLHADAYCKPDVWRSCLRRQCIQLDSALRASVCALALTLSHAPNDVEISCVGNFRGLLVFAGFRSSELACDARSFAGLVYRLALVRLRTKEASQRHELLSIWSS